MTNRQFEQELRSLFADGESAYIRQLVGLVGLIRPAVASNVAIPRERFSWLSEILTADAHLAGKVARCFSQIFSRHSASKLLAESGIVSTRSFWSDLSAKLNRKLLPEYYPDEDVRQLLHRAFNRRTDYVWLSAISPSDWHRFMQCLRKADDGGLYTALVDSLYDSLIVLSQRITAIAYEPEIDSKLPELDSADSPFLELARSTNLLIKAKQAISNAQNVELCGSIIGSTIDDCKRNIEHIYDNKDKYGVCMHFIYLIKRLEQQVDRYSMLLATIYHAEDRKTDSHILALIQQLLLAEKQRNSIRKHLHTNSRLLLYKIAVNTSKTGEHYQVASAKEYMVMLRAALGGGLVVALLACFKLGVSYLPLSPLGTAVGYSLNYAVGFVAIYLLHFTLATKQPAMTASTIAKTLANGDSSDMITPETLLLIRQIARSQFVSLLGNVAAALPFAWLVATAFSHIGGGHIVEAGKSVGLMSDISPWTSLSLFYAAIAGVYLMLSGVIAGYYDNLILHNNFYLRVRHHNGLNRLFGERRTRWFALYISNNLGNLMGNVALGLFLGATSTVGHFIGLPLDIRHVTFSAANFGIALADYSGIPPLTMLLQVGIGIFGIGLMNVLVSFGFSIAIALYSHGANPSEYVRLIRVLLNDFFRRPHQYILPLKSKGK